MVHSNRPRSEDLISICTSDTAKADDTSGDSRVPDVRPDPHALNPQERGTLSLAVNIALKGGQRSRTVFELHVKPYCDSPIRIGRRVSSKKRVGVEASMWVACRKCGKCLQFRQMRWRARALTEIAKAPRTWMVSLTFSPLHLAGVLAAAALSDKTDATARIDNAAYPHIQRFLKRMRRAYKKKLRFLAVFERGEKTGRAHYHLLLHEVDGPILKQWIEEQWPSHVHARLVDKARPGAASYVTKYATKSLSVRVRASGSYGLTKPPMQKRGGRGYHLPTDALERMNAK